MFTSAPSSHSPRAVHLRVDGVSKSFVDRRVLTNVSLTVSAGQRVGLIGENGSGKSTLLRIIAGLTTPDAGSLVVSRPGGIAARVGLLHQEPPFTSRMTLAHAIETAVVPVRAAVQAVEEAAVTLAGKPGCSPAERAYVEALDTAERLQAWQIDARIAEMLAGLGLSAVPTDRETGRLSGGQRSRLSVACVLLSAPDVLLLDEPTNHLDDHATHHLHQVLTSWSGPVVAASHDRAFLDDMVTSLADLDPAPLPHAVTGPLDQGGEGAGIGLTRFSGSYTDYLRARLDARQRWERQYRDEQGELKRLRAGLHDNQSVGHADFTPRTEVRAAAKFYADRNAKVVSRRVNDTRSRLEELTQQQVRKPQAELKFCGLTVATTGAPRSWSGPVLSAVDITIPGRLASLSLSINPGQKLLITGPNGCGKSTLLHILAGELSPTTGTLNTPRSLRIGLLTQEVDLPDPAARGPHRSVRQAYEDLIGAHRAAQVPLSTFGLLSRREENRSVSVLSTGQQRRASLAVLLANPPDVLLLDEPTNHLALGLVTQLEAAIPMYPGTVVVASHDRWLRHHWNGPTLNLA